MQRAGADGSDTLSIGRLGVPRVVSVDIAA
jgi:hypothetical protein